MLTKSDYDYIWSWISWNVHSEIQNAVMRRTVNYLNRENMTVWGGSVSVRTVVMLAVFGTTQP